MMDEPIPVVTASGTRGAPAPAFASLTDRACVQVRGPEARAFLQGLISNDIERVMPTRSIYAALLTPQGKYLFDFIIAAWDDGFLLETERARTPDLIRRLMMYRLRSKVELEDMGDRLTVGAVFGPAALEALALGDHPGQTRAIDGGIALVDPRLSELGVRIIATRSGLETATAGFAALTGEAYDEHRLHLGAPDGSRDLVLERSTLLESGFDELNGVDFRKGCFVGQELTARMKYRGLVRKRLLPVAFSGPAPEPGTMVKLGERDAGEIRSVGKDIGLALLRLEMVAKAKDEGLELRAGDARVEPQPPSWLKLETS